MRSQNNVKFLIAGLLLLPVAASCNKNASPEDGAAGAKTNTDQLQPSPQPSSATIPAGTLALETGDIELRVSGVSSAASFAAANSSSNASAGQPGVLAIGAGLAHSSISASLTNPPWPAFRPDSITSGAPDGFKVSVAKIALRPDKGPDALLLDHSTGVTIALDSGTMDLSQLIAAGKAGSDANSARFSVPVGSYKSIKVTYLRGAEIKGCVSGDFNSMNGLPEANGQHTYCTRAGYSTFDPVKPTPSLFENRPAAEWMKFDIGGANFSTAIASQTFDVEYKIPGGISVVKDAVLDLSMVMDLNRMLRFYNQGRSDQGSGPNEPTDRSYFFTSIFGSSVYVFVGKPGRIYGYEGRAKACKFSRWNETTHSCNIQAGDPGEFVIAYWMTIITASDGSPIITSFMPDDDNTLTVIKGSTHPLVNPYKPGSNSNLANIHYGLNEELGFIRNFPIDLEDAAVGEEILGLTFEAHQSATCTADKTCDYQGDVFSARRL